MKTLLLYLLLAVALYADPQTYKARLEVRNNGNYPANIIVKPTRYSYVSETIVFGPDQSYSVAPNSTLNEVLEWTVDTGHSDPIEFEVYRQLPGNAGATEPGGATISNISKVGSSFVVVSGSGTTSRYVTNLPGHYDGQFGSGPMPYKKLVFSDPVAPDGAKPIWETNDSSLTANLYREGVDKIVGAIALGGGGGSSGGGGSGGDGGGGEPATGDPAVDSDRELVASKQLGLNVGNGYSVDAGTGEVTISNPENINGTSTTAVANADLVKNAVGSARNIKAFGGNTSGYTDTPGTANFGVAFRDVSISLDPLEYPEIATGLGFIRKLIAWAVVLVFEVWVWGYFSQFMKDVASSPQARGNAVLAGSGGQATALIAAVAITAAIVSIPALFWALTDNVNTLQSIGVNPLELAGAPGYAVHLFNCTMPVATIVTVTVSYFIVRKGAVVLYVGVATVIRFIIP